jgi:four helix bundle protein
MHNFKKLKIWQLGIDITDDIYEICKMLPREEKYNLSDQMRRSATSIPSNIAEGSGKRTSLHFREFITTALSSAFELETQLIIVERRKYLPVELTQALMNKVSQIQKMLYVIREKQLTS